MKCYGRWTLHINIEHKRAKKNQFIIQFAMRNGKELN